MYLVLLHGRARRPGRLPAARLRVHAGHEGAVGAEHFEHVAAHARHDLHADDHVGAVAELDTEVRDLRVDRPMLNGTTYIVRPFMDPLKSGRSLFAALRASPRRHPVVRRAGVFLAFRADEVRSSTAPRRPRRCGRGSSSTQVGIQAPERAASTSCVHRRAYSSSLPSHIDRARFGQRDISATQAIRRALVT